MMSVVKSGLYEYNSVGIKFNMHPVLKINNVAVQ